MSNDAKCDIFYDFLGPPLIREMNAYDEMRAIGISWEKAVPQTLGDMIQFFGCTNVPEILPPYMRRYPARSPYPR